MKYSVSIDINLPRHQVVSLFDNPDNLKYWQPELVSFEHLSGELGKEGATSNLVYKMGDKHVEMIETIVQSALPDIFSATYETKGVWNLVENHFIEMPLDPMKTQWRSDNEFKCSGFLKVMAFLMPSMFKKQSMVYMEQFKAFAEK